MIIRSSRLEYFEMQGWHMEPVFGDHVFQKLGRHRRRGHQTVLFLRQMDIANRDDAHKALNVARRHLSSDPPNIASAKRFALKSLSLFETSEASNLLEKIRLMEEEAKNDQHSARDSSATNVHATGAEAHASSEGMKHRTTHTASTAGGDAKAKGKAKDDEKREYTTEQLAIVKRIRKCKVTEYYEILSLTKDCEEADVKKAYRKVSEHFGHYPSSESSSSQCHLARTTAASR